jgi:hypothetical protein
MPLVHEHLPEVLLRAWGSPRLKGEGGAPEGGRKGAKGGSEGS